VPGETNLKQQRKTQSAKEQKLGTKTFCLLTPALMGDPFAFPDSDFGFRETIAKVSNLKIF
jgi:hypothetical protein